MDNEDYRESDTIRLDWTIRGLKQLFDLSKGEAKSKATKSLKFGGGRWQVLFYPNSGTDGGQYFSFYLSCEPTADERDNAVNGRWVREGLYKFSFELRSPSGAVLCNSKEANDHSFSWKTANWGWAQFARRDTVYYQQSSVRNSDAFLITCIINSAPTAPAKAPNNIYRSVPRDLLDVVGSLLDDPTYSDVVFILPSRISGHPPRKIYAAKSVLNRVEYFKSMFNSGFAESTPQVLLSSTVAANNVDMDVHGAASDLTQHYDDSDEDDERAGTSSDSKQGLGLHHPSNIVQSADRTETKVAFSVMMSPKTPPESSDIEGIARTANIDMDVTHVETVDDDDDDERVVPAKQVRPFTPHSATPRLEPETGPAKTVVVVNDVAYTTYRSVLRYIYTDNIVFAPLSSSFLSPVSHTGSPQASTSSPSQGEGHILNPPLHSRFSSQADLVTIKQNSRRAWLKDWEKHCIGDTSPCSAKAVYRVADKIRLDDLKARAFQHIVKSLTVDNIPYELFSGFSAMFEEVRKVQFKFFLQHWSEIRASPAMRVIWQQIRIGRHPGFEEVWPLIAMNLEFRPQIIDESSEQSMMHTSQKPNEGQL